MISKKVYQTLVETITYGVQEIDTSGVITFGNKSYFEMLGYEPKELLGKHIWDVLADEAQKEELEPFLKQLVEHKPPPAPYFQKNLTKDGRIIDVRVDWNYKRDKKGVVNGFISILTDITTQKKFEELLRQHEASLATAQAIAKVGSWEWDIAKNRTLYSDEFCRIFKIESGRGTDAYEYFLNRVHPEDRELVDMEVAACLSEIKPFDMVYRTTLPDDSVHFIHSRGEVFPDGAGKPLRMVGTVQDITDQKEAEKTLRDSEERYRTLTSNIPGMVYRGRADWSPEAITNSEAVCGYSVEELIAQKINWLEDVIHSDDKKRIIEENAQMIENRWSIIQRYRILSKDDRISHVEDHKAPIFSEEGVFCGVDGVVFDVTERIQHEEALQKAHKGLEERVLQRTTELAKAIRNLRDENEQRKKAEEMLLKSQKELRLLASEQALAEERVRRRLATDVHDNISQNLAATKLSLSSLRDSVSSSEFANPLDEAIELLSQTIENTRSLTVELSPPVLYDLGLEAAVKWLLRRMKRLHSLSGKLELHGTFETLRHNVEILLFQAIRELLFNVVKHAKALNVIVSIRKSGKELEVTVEDDGIGFNPSEVTSQNEEESAFGLFSIRERLYHMGGRFDISSTPKQGTKVTLVVPENHSKKIP
jgi:PAS domain S-box-containing protein